MLLERGMRLPMMPGASPRLKKNFPRSCFSTRAQYHRYIDRWRLPRGGLAIRWSALHPNTSCTIQSRPYLSCQHHPFLMTCAILLKETQLFGERIGREISLLPPCFSSYGTCFSSCWESALCGNAVDSSV